MHHAVLSSVPQSPSRLDDDEARFLRIQAPFSGDVLAQIDTVDELECQVIRVLYFAPVVQRDDVFMAEPGGIDRFALETLEHIGLARHGGGKNLESHLAAQL